MAVDKNKHAETTELSVEEKLKILYELQSVDSKVDNIKTLRGELPLEVQDLEDEIEGLETRVNNLHKEVEEIDSMIVRKKQEIKEAETLIKKYEDQQSNVRNNREFDSIQRK